MFFLFHSPYWVFTMPLRIVGKTDKGRRRSRNEDAFLIMEGIGLCSVADGMGGHYGGNIASSIAVQILSECFSETYNPKKDGGELEFLQATISRGNVEIYDRNRQDMFPSGMGTTVVAILIKEPKAFLGFVGDSRIYLFRGERLSQVSDDHSLVAELIRNGIISKDEAMYHQNKNIITRALGMNEQVQVDGKTLELEEGDLFLLCSDGLSDLISDRELENVLRHRRSDLESCVEELVLRANNAGGFDNITVVLALYSQHLVPSLSTPAIQSSCKINEETATIDLETLQKKALELNQSLSPNTATPAYASAIKIPSIPLEKINAHPSKETREILPPIAVPELAQRPLSPEVHSKETREILPPALPKFPQRFSSSEVHSKETREISPPASDQPDTREDFSSLLSETTTQTLAPSPPSKSPTELSETPNKSVEEEGSATRKIEPFQPKNESFPFSSPLSEQITRKIPKDKE
jgi:serine/threonine protein phosphatase PrpC